MATEKTLQAYICKKARQSGILAYKWSSPSQRGVPDLILVFPGGVTVYIEVKHPNGTGRLSRLQEIEIQKLTEQGAQVYVVASRDAADRIIESGLDASAE